MIKTITVILFSTIAVVVVVVISSLLMAFLTWTFCKERIHRKSFVLAWIIFLVFLFLGLFYIHYSYRKVVTTHTNVYRNISQHCVHVLSNRVQSVPSDSQSDNTLWIYNYLRDCEKNDSLIFSIYLVRQPQTSLDSESFLFLNLTTPLLDSQQEPERWQPIPLERIFGQPALPQPIASAFLRESAIGIVKRTDYGENRLIYAVPLFERDGEIDTVLCLTIREQDWQQEFLYSRILPHLFFCSFLFFFFAMQIVLVRRRIMVKNLREHRIVSFEQTLDQLIAVKMVAEEKSVERNYLIRQVDSEFKKPLIPILESSYLLGRQFFELPNISDPSAVQEFRLANSITLEKMLWDYKKLEKVLKNIRTFIDLEWNQLEIRRDEFSPQQLIHDLRDICQQYLWEKPDIKFRIDTVSEIPNLVCGDRVKIQYVLEELLKLTMDRVRDGHIKITCYISNSQLCWIILDTSEIPMEKEIGQLNDFYNSGLAFSPESYGKPIFRFDFGSSIAAAFVQLLKAAVTFQSNAGHGNKCTAVFPIEM
ncbi:MAG: hypothetical protein LBK82_12680 [Planctomycetaceae bacterium]|jgi:signal transduction histidine kinase|nr:hypothetical protein [Planctomycetaceae bacterium]